MNENEIRLIEMIRNSKDPEKALITAVNVIVDFLKSGSGIENKKESA